MLSTSDFLLNLCARAKAVCPDLFKLTSLVLQIILGKSILSLSLYMFVLLLVRAVLSIDVLCIVSSASYLFS